MCGQAGNLRSMILFGLLLALLSAAGHAQEVEEPAKAEPEGRAPMSSINVPGIHADTRIARIQTRSDLEGFLQEAGEANPFDFFSPGKKRAFLDSLVFTDKGLGSFDADILRSGLPAKHAYRVLALFGLQRLAPVVLDAPTGDGAARGDDASMEEDCPLLEDMRCELPATCVRRTGAVCITCNCGVIPPDAD